MRCPSPHRRLTARRNSAPWRSTRCCPGAIYPSRCSTVSATACWHRRRRLPFPAIFKSLTERSLPPNPLRRPKRRRKNRVPPSAGTSISSRRHSTCGTPTRVGGTENHGLGLAAAMRPQQMHDVMGRGGHCIVRYPLQSIDVEEYSGGFRQCQRERGLSPCPAASQHRLVLCEHYFTGLRALGGTAIGRKKRVAWLGQAQAQRTRACRDRMHTDWNQVAHRDQIADVPSALMLGSESPRKTRRASASMEERNSEGRAPNRR